MRGELNRDCSRDIYELVRNCFETIWVKTSNFVICVACLLLAVLQHKISMQAIVLTIIAGTSLNVVLLCHCNEAVTKSFVATMQGECNALFITASSNL